MHREYNGFFKLLYLSAGLQEAFKNFLSWAPQDLIDVATWPEQVCQLSRSLSSLSMFHPTYVPYIYIYICYQDKTGENHSVIFPHAMT